jgi:predicted  nucleic acid-binding Zn-ribbon protein
MDNMTQEMLRERVDQASSRMADLQKKADDLDKKLSDANSIEEMAELARMLTEVRSDIQHLEMVRDKTMSQLDEDLARMKSPEYKSAVKKMDQIKADNKKRVKTIDDTMHLMMDQIDELHQACREYDVLHRQHIRTGYSYGLMMKYGWINILRGHLYSLTHNLVYKTWSRS